MDIPSFSPLWYLFYGYVSIAQHTSLCCRYHTRDFTICDFCGLDKTAKESIINNPLRWHNILWFLDLSCDVNTICCVFLLTKENSVIYYLWTTQHKRNSALRIRARKALHIVSARKQVRACIPCVFPDTWSVYHGSLHASRWHCT